MTELKLEELRAGSCGRAFVEWVNLRGWPAATRGDLFDTYPGDWKMWVAAWLGCQREIGREAQPIHDRGVDNGNYAWCSAHPEYTTPWPRMLWEFIAKLSTYGEPHD